MEMDPDDEKRILLKQWLFIINEQELKTQAKQEKLQRQQQRRAAQNQRCLDGTTPRMPNPNKVRNSSDENEETLKESSKENNGSQRRRRHSGNSSRNQMNDEMYQSLEASHISLQKELPLLGTYEIISARRKEYLNEVELSQIMDVPTEFQGMIKTLTEKSII